MNKVKHRLSLLFALLICFFIVSCEDDNAMEGKVYITFENSSSDLHIAIYSTCNEQVPIYDEILKNDEAFEYILNTGNYIVKPYSSTIFYGKTGFQILQNKTTHVQYDLSLIHI